MDAAPTTTPPSQPLSTPATRDTPLRPWQIVFIYVTLWLVTALPFQAFAYLLEGGRLTGRVYVGFLNMVVPDDLTHNLRLLCFVFFIVAICYLPPFLTRDPKIRRWLRIIGTFIMSVTWHFAGMLAAYMAHGTV